MKVVCAGCQAKYQIPDERVAGRKLKIRCRKCGEAIIVRGDQAQAASAAGQQPYSMPSADEWHVSLDGDQHGPYPIEQMAVMLRNGQLAWDAYVWRDGFGDWKTAGDSDTLVRAVAAGAETAQDDDPTSARLPAPEALQPLARSAFAARAAHRSSPQLAAAPYQASQPAAYDYSHEAAQQSGYPEASYADNGYGQGQYQEAGYAQGGYAEGGYEQAGYAQPEYAEGGYAAEGHAEGGYAEGGYAEGGYAEDGYGASPRVTAGQALTGERHEDSVLFSARNMQLAASSGMSQPPRAGHAGGEGSGLIDIRALASLARTTQTGGAVPAKSNGHSNGRGRDRDEVLSTFAHQTGAFGRIDSLAPVDRPSRTSSNAVPLAIVTGSAMVAAAAFLGVYLTRDSGAAATAPAAVSNAPALMAEAPAAAPAEPPAEAEAQAAEPTAAAAEPAAAADTEPERIDEPEAAPSKPATSSRSSSKSRSSSRRSERAERSERSLRATKAEPKAKPEKSDSSSESASAKKGASPSIDDLLLADAKPEPKPAPAAAPEVALPLKPAAPAGKRSIDDLLDNAVENPGSGKKPQAAAAASSAALPDTPSREQVTSAMKGVAGAVKACAEGQTLETPTATVAVTVAGATGNVSGVRVTGIQGIVGSCVARAVRGANFPKFAKEQLTINYPFKLK